MPWGGHREAEGLVSERELSPEHFAKMLSHPSAASLCWVNLEVRSLPASLEMGRALLAASASVDSPALRAATASITERLFSSSAAAASSSWASI